MKNAKNNQKNQTALCTTLAKLLATGLACAAVLIGSPLPATPAGGNISHGNTGIAGAWADSGDCDESGTGNGQEISPQNDWKPKLEQAK